MDINQECMNWLKEIPQVCIDNNKKGLALDLGFRLNKHSIYGNNQTFTFNPSYQADEHTRIFGSFATAFKIPSLFQLFDQKFLNFSCQTPLILESC